MTKACIWTGRTEDYFTFRFEPEQRGDDDISCVTSVDFGFSEVADLDARRVIVRKVLDKAYACRAPDLRMGVYHLEADKAFGIIIPLGLSLADVEMIVMRNIAGSLKGLPESETA